MIAAAMLAAAAGVAGAGGSWLQNGFVLPVLLFGLMIAYQGVRIGRSTHLVDMADENRRAAYTALSNTIIGVVLVAGGVFGIVADIAGIPAVLGIFALMSAGAVVTAYGLDEVQQ